MGALRREEEGWGKGGGKGWGINVETEFLQMGREINSGERYLVGRPKKVK